MERNIIMAGFGGQGVMLMGKLLSFATCDSTDLNVTFFPSYGAEQRGGTANCYVVISDAMIGSPMAGLTDDLIVLNQASMDKFEDRIKPGSVVFANTSIVIRTPDRDDIKVVGAPATEIAIEMGSEKVLNIIMLGMYIGYTKILPEQIVLDTILKKLGKKANMIAMNKAAFARGLEIGKSAAEGRQQ